MSERRGYHTDTADEASPDPGSGVPGPEEIDAQELLDASHRAIAAVRRQAARLLGARPGPQTEPDAHAKQEPPGP